MSLRRALQILALLVAGGAAAFWLATGANRGWTKNFIEVKLTDPVTGIEGSQREKHFVPGVDFLGAAALASVVLAGASLICKSSPKKT